MSTQTKFGKNRTKIRDALNEDENTFMDTLVNNVTTVLLLLWVPWLPTFLRFHMLPELAALLCLLQLRECAKRFRPEEVL